MTKEGRRKLRGQLRRKEKKKRKMVKKKKKEITLRLNKETNTLFQRFN